MIQNIKLSTINLLFILILGGCSGGKKHKQTNNRTTKTNHPRSKASSSVAHVTFKQDASYGATKNFIVGTIASFAVDGSGRVFIADEGKTTVEVFSPEGHYLKSLGRQGNGPGEFAAVSPKTDIWVHSGRLYVPDYKNAYNYFPDRIQIFSLDSLAFIHTIQLLAPNKDHYKELGTYYPDRVYPLSAGRFLVEYRQPPGEYQDSTSYIRYMIQDRTGTILKGPVLQLKDRTNLIDYTYSKKAGRPYTAIIPFPFFGKSVLVQSTSGRLYTVKNTQQFKFDVYTPKGKHLRSFRQPFQKVPLSRRRLIKQYQHKLADMGKGIAAAAIRHAQNLPNTWPALESMFFDDKDRLWVSTIVNNFNVYQWWVLKKSGGVIAKFKWPRDKPIKAVRNGYMYTLETDKKTGLQRVVRYRIEMEPSEK